MCISAYLEAARVLDMPEARAFALKSLDRVLGWSGERRWDEKIGMAHVVAYGEAGAAQRRVAGRAGRLYVSRARGAGCVGGDRRVAVLRRLRGDRGGDAGAVLRCGRAAASSIPRLRRGRDAAGRAEGAAEAAAGLADAGGQSGGGGAAAAAGGAERRLGTMRRRRRRRWRRLPVWSSTLGCMRRATGWRCSGWCSRRCRCASSARTRRPAAGDGGAGAVCGEQERSAACAGSSLGRCRRCWRRRCRICRCAEGCGSFAVVCSGKAVCRR